MEQKIYIDGNYYTRENAKISVFDHGLLYGDGIFEGIRIYNSKVFKLKEHIHRLYNSAKSIYLELMQTEEEMETIVLDAVKVNQKVNGYIRLVVTRGDGNLGVDPHNCSKPSVIVIVGDIQLYPEEYYTRGIEIITSTYRRIPSECFDLRIKSLNYLNNVLAKMEARKQNCLESILLNTHGFVTECTGDNIFIVKNGVVITPALYHGVLEGITRNTVLEIAPVLNLKTAETSLTRYDLYQADECFLTGTGAEIIPVNKIDTIAIGNGKPGEITKKIIQEFKKITQL